MGKQNSLNKYVLFVTLIFSLVNVTSVLKALFLLLDYNVRMICDFNTFLHILYAYLVTFTLFVYLFNKNTKYRDIYRKSAKKIQRYEFVLISPSPIFYLESQLPY